MAPLSLPPSSFNFSVISRVRWPKVAVHFQVPVGFGLWAAATEVGDFGETTLQVALDGGALGSADGEAAEGSTLTVGWQHDSYSTVSGGVCPLGGSNDWRGVERAFVPAKNGC